MKLTPELVPTSTHYKNLRSILKPSDWKKISLNHRNKTGNICEICGDTGIKQGYKHYTECHEIWEYDDINHIQTLIGLISLCPTCHKCKHFALHAMKGGNRMVTIMVNHMCKINNASVEEINTVIMNAFKQNSERSKHTWTVNTDYINDKI